MPYLVFSVLLLPGIPLEPARIREQLQEEFQVAEVQRKRDRALSFNETAQKSWLSSLSRIRSEGKALELIPRAHDEHFNNTIVRPIVNAASTEYGKLVKALANDGLEKLSPELAVGLAEMVLRASATAVSFDTRDRALQIANTLQENVARTTKYERPGLGQRTTTPSAGPQAYVRGGTF